MSMTGNITYIKIYIHHKIFTSHIKTNNSMLAQLIVKTIVFLQYFVIGKLF